MQSKKFTISFLCILTTMVTMCTFIHGTQSPHDVGVMINAAEQLKKDLYNGLENYDVDLVRESLQAGICTDISDTESEFYPINIVMRQLFLKSCKPPRINTSAWQERFFQTLDLFFTKTDLKVDLVQDLLSHSPHPSDYQYITHSFNLLQACFLAHRVKRAIIANNNGISRIDIAKYLITKGARLHHKNNLGQTSLHVLVEHLSHDRSDESPISTFLYALQEAYPQPTSGDQCPCAFAKDITKIDLNSGSLSPKLVCDIGAPDIECLSSLRQLKQRTHLYQVSAAFRLTVQLKTVRFPLALIELIATLLDDDIAEKCILPRHAIQRRKTYLMYKSLTNQNKKTNTPTLIVPA